VKIIWTPKAKRSLKGIYNYYKQFSIQGAKNVRTDILQAPNNIQYPKQYQVDDFNPDYRRIIVRGDYKLLYNESENVIRVMNVVATKQSTTY
jgi:addiction module RelE/StbE family toxin